MTDDSLERKELKQQLQMEILTQKGAALVSAVAKYITKVYHIYTLNLNEEIFIYNTKSGVYIPNGRRKLMVETQNLIPEAASIHIKKEVVDNVRCRTIRDLKDLDQEANIINVRNGLLNLDTCVLQPHTPDIFTTQQLPVLFNPDADCPKIGKFLSELVEPEHLEVLMETFGFVLIRPYRYHKIIIFVGPTHSGKTTLTRLQKRFFGKSNVSSVMLQKMTEDPTSLMHLYGKLANITDDLPSNLIKHSGILKQITGESDIHTRRIYELGIDWTNVSKIIATCNDLPVARDADDAYYGRFIIIPTPNCFIAADKCNRNLFDELTSEDELSGLLNLAIKKRKQIMDNNGFSYTNDIAEIKARYLQYTRGSGIGAFISDQIILDAESFTLKNDVFEAYNTYCAANKRVAKTEDTFHRGFRELMTSVEDYRPTIGDVQERAYKGIRLNVSSQ